MTEPSSPTTTSTGDANLNSCPNIRVNDADRIRTVTIDRPEAKGAMRGDMWDALGDALADAQDNPEVAVVVLTGTGDAFCSGVDLTEMAEIAMGAGSADPHAFPRMADTMAAFTKPLIVAINGIGVMAVAAARSVVRARCTSWRTAPSVTPRSRAMSALMELSSTTRTVVPPWPRRKAFSGSSWAPGVSAGMA